jgi:hypothetical protein
MHTGTTIPLQSGLFESLAPLVSVAATLVLALMLLALGGVAYRSLRGDGIRWPDETDEDDDETAVRRSGDDEWKYH